MSANKFSGVKTAVVVLKLSPRIFKEGFAPVAEAALCKRLDAEKNNGSRTVDVSAMEKIAEKFAELGSKSWRKNSTARSKAAEYFVKAGDIYEEIGQYSKAAMCYNKASEKSPDFAESYKYFGLGVSARKTANHSHFINLPQY